MTFDGKAFGAEIVGAVKAHVAEVLAPVTDRLDALEKRLSELPTPKDGKDADEEAIAARVSEMLAGELAEIRTAVEAIPEPSSISDVDVETVEDGRTMVLRFTIGDVEHAFEVALPVGPAGEKGEAGPAGADGRDGADGKD